tara:strand:+ start:172 stop:984 length:813 start_codon:yes stop_codon:yes gene_type:complete
MIGLKKIYSNSEIAGSYPYFSRIVKNGLPLNRSIRYSFQEELAKASVLEKTYGSSIGKENSVVKFLFSIDKYDTKMLNRHTSFNKHLFKIKENIPKIKKGLQKDKFFIGCVLKQVKGGFTIDLGGLVCFMPYSLSEGTRFIPYTPKKNTAQLFQAYGLSLVATPEKEIFLNLIVSRKNNIKLLKGLIKNFLKSGSEDLRYSALFNDTVKSSRTKNTQLRLVSNLTEYKGKGVNLIRFVRESKLSNKSRSVTFLHVLQCRALQPTIKPSWI